MSLLRKLSILLQECPEDWYGLDCKQLCSGNCKGKAVCNHVTGQCDEGCAAGWKGTLCDQGLQMWFFCNYFTVKIFNPFSLTEIFTHYGIDNWKKYVITFGKTPGGYKVLCMSEILVLKKVDTSDENLV